MVSSGTALADAVVIASSASKYKQGDEIAHGQLIDLKPGESVTLLLETGETLFVDKAMTLSDPPKSGGRRSAVSALLKNNQRESVAGATRGPGACKAVAGARTLEALAVAAAEEPKCEALARKRAEAMIKSVSPLHLAVSWTDTSPPKLRGRVNLASYMFCAVQGGNGETWLIGNDAGKPAKLKPDGEFEVRVSQALRAEGRCLAVLDSDWKQLRAAATALPRGDREFDKFADWLRSRSAKIAIGGVTSGA